MASDFVGADGRILVKYPNVRIKRDVLPYGDLQISGRWPRDAGVPDDMIPMIGPPLTYDDNWVPRVMRSTKDGALIVSDSGGSGSSGTSGLTITNQQFDFAADFTDWDQGSGLLNRYVFGWSWAIWKADNSFVDGTFASVSLAVGVTSIVTLNGLILDSAWFMPLAGGNNPTIYQNTVALAVPIDLQGSGGGWRPVLISGTRDHFRGGYVIWSGGPEAP